jgi:hypothetical protein
VPLYLVLGIQRHYGQIVRVSFLRFLVMLRESVSPCECLKRKLSSKEEERSRKILKIGRDGKDASVFFFLVVSTPANCSIP